jgi:hypothetical protein
MNSGSFNSPHDIKGSKEEEASEDRDFYRRLLFGEWKSGFSSLSGVVWQSQSRGKRIGY